MNKSTFLATLLLAATAHAQPDVIYTPTSGTFAVTVEAAPSDVDAFDTASVEVRGAGFGACAAVGPGAIVEVPVTVPLVDLPATIRAVAWSEPLCAGLESPLSSNEGTLTLRAPGAPVLR